MKVSNIGGADGLTADFPQSVYEFIAAAAIAAGDWVSLTAPGTVEEMDVTDGDKAGLLSAGVALDTVVAGAFVRVVTAGDAVASIGDTGTITVGDVAVPHATTDGASGLVNDTALNTGTTDVGIGVYTSAEIGSSNTAKVCVAPSPFIVGSQVGDGQLDGTNVATLADVATDGGIPVIYRIATAGGATANTDVTIDHKIQVLDVTVLNKGAGTASDTITITDGTTAITDAIDISGADKTVARAATIDDAVYAIAASGTLRVTETDGGGSDSPATDVTVYAIRVA